MPSDEIMQDMKGCANYKKLCIKDSKVTGWYVCVLMHMWLACLYVCMCMCV